MQVAGCHFEQVSTLAVSDRGAPYHSFVQLVRGYGEFQPARSRTAIASSHASRVNRARFNPRDRGDRSRRVQRPMRDHEDSASGVRGEDVDVATLATANTYEFSESSRHLRCFKPREPQAAFATPLDQLGRRRSRPCFNPRDREQRSRRAASGQLWLTNLHYSFQPSRSRPNARSPSSDSGATFLISILATSRPRNGHRGRCDRHGINRRVVVYVSTPDRGQRAATCRQHQARSRSAQVLTLATSNSDLDRSIACMTCSRITSFQPSRPRTAISVPQVVITETPIEPIAPFQPSRLRPAPRVTCRHSSGSFNSCDRVTRVDTVFEMMNEISILIAPYCPVAV